MSIKTITGCCQTEVNYRVVIIETLESGNIVTLFNNTDQTIEFVEESGSIVTRYENTDQTIEFVEESGSIVTRYENTDSTITSVSESNNTELSSSTSIQ